VPDATCEPPTSVAAGAASIRRDTEEIRLANLAARVAAAGRRILTRGSLDEHRDLPVLRAAQRLLQAGAATLSDDVTPNYSDVVQQESYTLARITHSALRIQTAQPGRTSETNRRLATARELRELADDIAVLLDPEAKTGDLRSAAHNVSKVFSRISATVLRELGRSGDSTGGRNQCGTAAL
jgi:hypothetical protein